MKYIHIRLLFSYPNIMAYIRSMTEVQQQEPHFDSRTALNYYFIKTGLAFKVTIALLRVVQRSVQ